MDAAYLKAHVGGELAAGLAHTVQMQPDDPVAFLAQFLLAADAKKLAATTAAAEREAAEKNAADKAEAARVIAIQKEKAAAAAKAKEDGIVAALDEALEKASSAEEVYTVCMKYVTDKMGASTYVALTDLPDKEVKIPESPSEESPTEPAEGEEGASAEPEPEPEEAPEPPPKFNPTLLTYVAASPEATAQLMVGKKLARPAAPEGAEEDAPVPRGNGEGVSFDAIDAFLSDGAKCMYLPQAIQNRSVKFWSVPRVGSLSIAPIADADGDVLGIIAADTLSGGRMDPGISADFGTLADKASSALCRIAIEVAKCNVAAIAELSAAYEKSRTELEAALAAAAEEEGTEGGDKLASLKAKQKRAADDLVALSGDKLNFLATRKAVPREVLQVLKGVMRLIAPESAAAIASMDWDGMKAAAIKEGSLPWGKEFFTKVGNYNVLGSKDVEGFTAATGESGYVPLEVDTEALKASSFVAFLLLNWLRDTSALFTAKLEEEKAAAAAEAEAAAAAAAAEAEAAAAAEAEAAAAAEAEAAASENAPTAED